MQKGIRHIRHCRNIPFADVAIGGIGFRLIIKPKVDRGLEIGISRSRHSPSSRKTTLELAEKEAWIKPLLELERKIYFLLNMFAIFLRHPAKYSSH